MVHQHYTQTYRYCVRCGGTLTPSVIRTGDPERLVCETCGFVQYLDPKVASCAIVRQDRKLVLLQRGIEPAYGKWVFPGGYVDRGETPEQAAMREAKEEAGVDIRIDDLVGAYSYEGAPIIVVVYAATILSGEPQALDESLDMRLHHRDEIPWEDLAFPSTRDALHDYCQQFWPEAS